jgi:MFS family permease
MNRATDRVGRVPVLLVATVGLAIASLTFGFSSKHLWAVAFTRFLGTVL